MPSVAVTTHTASIDFFPETTVMFADIRGKLMKRESLVVAKSAMY